MKIFVIMPFSQTTEKHTEQYWNDFYSNIYKILKEKNNDEVKKILNVNDFEVFKASAPQGNIVKNIIKNLIKSDIVIAILTDYNPNVFYELGIRHTQSSKTIMFCETAVRIPFDLNNYGIALYRDNRFRYKTIEKELMKRLKEISANSNKPDNPFQDFFSHIIKNSSINNTQETIKVDVVNRINGESILHLPAFYREIERTPGNNIKYKNSTAFTLIIELLSYVPENITIVDTELIVTYGSTAVSTSTIYYESVIHTSTWTVPILSKYRNKLTIEPKKLYQFNTAFILFKRIPFEINETKGFIKIRDMYGNYYQSPEFIITPYTKESKQTIEMAQIIEKYGENSPEFLVYSQGLDDNGDENT